MDDKARCTRRKNNYTVTYECCDAANSVLTKSAWQIGADKLWWKLMYSVA